MSPWIPACVSAGDEGGGLGTPRDVTACSQVPQVLPRRMLATDCSESFCRSRLDRRL